MAWLICFILSLIFAATAVVLALLRGIGPYKTGRWFGPWKILFLGVVLSSLALYLPVYFHAVQEDGCGWGTAILISFHSMMRLFVADGNLDAVTEQLNGMAPWLFRSYSFVFCALIVSGPLLTFGFVLSFFENIAAYMRYLTHRKSDMFIFSELNEKSLALADSLYRSKHKDPLLVFTDVFATDEERSYELIEKAKELKAVCFKKDILTFDFSRRNKKRTLNFIIIGENPAENAGQALKIVEKLKYRDNTNLYVLTTQTEAEFLLLKAFNETEQEKKKTDNSEKQEIKIKVHRVNEVQSLIIRNLYDDGYEKIFQSAYDDNTGVKKINAVVVGMGLHGTEMTKALSWFCQMDGYLAEIHVIDVSPSAKDVFTSKCPELMAYSGKLNIPGETKYTIHIHSGVDVDSLAFDQLIQSLPRSTYAFVALGNDEKNVATAVKLRTLFERMKYKPVIQAVVYNTDKKEALNGIANFKKQPYDIDFIGDIKSSYCEKVIFGSDLEKQAQKMHQGYGGAESEFWRYDYNYKSSIASVIHTKMKYMCGIPAIDLAPAQRTPEERDAIRKLEHIRWNAYTRADGYIYGGTVEKIGRNDLAKMHNLLVPFDALPEKQKENDDVQYIPPEKLS